LKKYGIKPKRHNYIDNHPPKGYINWWEAELDSYSKKTARQAQKNDISQDLVDLQEGDKDGRS
jgi:hypothetical protein